MCCDVLKNKTVVFDGDSICHATTEPKPYRGWAYRIGTKYDMDWHNFGIGGGTITTELYYASGEPRHWVCRSIDSIHEQFPTLDYLILEGGTNDADLIYPNEERFGKVDPYDFSGNYDDTTFCGACETLFYKAITYYPNTKIGFIVAQKMGVTNNYTETNKRRMYFLKAIEICKKWGIPYLDVWDGCPLNPCLNVYFDGELDVEGNKAAGKAYVDGQHLSTVGYDLITPKIEAWMKTL